MTQTTNGTTPAQRVRGWVRRQQAAYGREDGAVLGYLPLMGAYVTGTTGAALIAWRTGRRAPRLTPFELAQLALATQRISRTIAKDPVTSPFRAPLTEFHGASGPGEVAESVRGHGLQHSAGELVTCPFCLAQWVATGLGFGMVFAPVATRLVLSVMSAVAGADALQFAYAALQKTE